MTNWKKYEGYVNDVKKYTLNVDSSIKKRLGAGLLLSTMAITSLTGCSISDNNTKQPVSVSEINYVNLDEEMAIKEAYVYNLFNIASDIGDPALDSAVRDKTNKYISENADYLELLKIDNSYRQTEYYKQFTDEEIKGWIIKNWDKAIEKLESSLSVYADVYSLDINYNEFVANFRNEHIKGK